MIYSDLVEFGRMRSIAKLGSFGKNGVRCVECLLSGRREEFYTLRTLAYACGCLPMLAVFGALSGEMVI